MSYYKPLQYIVPDSEDGWLLRTVLRGRMSLSKKLLSRLKWTPQGITVNGERCPVNVKLRAGDVVEVRMQEETSDDILPQNIPIEILHEDDHLLILNKPPNIIVHPTHGHYVNTLANAVAYYWQQLGKQHRFRPVHRLDQETSGVLAVAKNPYAHQQLSIQFQERRVKKSYRAIVHGVPHPQEGSIDGPIDRRAPGDYVRIVRPDGAPAVTGYRVMVTIGAFSLVEVKPQTGRTHQIRVHMRHIGCPIVGDKLYGFDCMELANGERSKDDWGMGYPIERHALHAATLSFLHPEDGREVTYEAPLPADMQALLDYASSTLTEPMDGK
ncbi:RluA family pseudouridine synthase [Xylanibacillus composti]|uniref:Pseudouridine synthase n=1 Tax=Xylanibacillus composti TaxID=1572762 RepID=A0A8J4M4A6_9BACL|nr:RluA family pseudouridine synthase [Xylanibacillus composti]MDT9724686.1 RluA family pseudouridine synthase [Xylanibacillus composti]GIQ70972.1 RNA pseudouridine synthase [Xylanibacillus composti]